MHSKISSAKWRPFYVGLDVLSIVCAYDNDITTVDYYAILTLNILFGDTENRKSLWC